jgi:hypothetical protein
MVMDFDEVFLGVAEEPQEEPEPGRRPRKKK